MNLVTHTVILVALALGGQACAQDASQNYPSRTIRIIVPFPAGGPTDVLARVIGQRMSEDWGQPVVIDNRPGANTAIGAQLMAKSSPDGYTLLAAMDTTMVINPVTSGNLSYDPARDFAPITMVASGNAMLIVRAADGPASVPDLIARAKANPGKLNFGAGIMTLRLAGYLFNRLAEIDVVFIPYKGSPDLVQGLLTGSVDFIFDGLASGLPLIQSGKLRALAKLNSRTLSALPDLKPLAVAANLHNLDDISSWTALVAPAGTPVAVIDKIQREVAKMYADPAIVERLERTGITATGSTAAELDAFFRKETERWSRFFKESGIKFD